MSYEIPANLLYLPTHQWVRIDSNIATVGITDYAQKALGSITWIDLPEKNSHISQKQILGGAESVKSTSDIPSPVTGKIIEINETLENTPDICNSDPYGKGWIAKIELSEKPENLLSAEEYKKLCEKE